MAMRDDIITAVQNYFSSDSDIYKKVMSGEGLTFGEMNAVLSSVPYMKPVTSISGSRLGFDADVPFKDVDVDRQIVQDLFDSNYGGSSYGSSFSGSIPGNFSYNSDTGRYTAVSGAKDSLGNIIPVIADKASLAVTGLNIGAKFGYAIDQALYENFPDFWRDVFGNVTPQDFADIFSEDTFGNKFVRTLFGIKDGQVMPYVSEETIAATYQALRDAGAFGDGNIVPAPIPAQDESFIINGEDIVATIARNYAGWIMGNNNPFNRWDLTMDEFINDLRSKASQSGIDLSQYTGNFISTQTGGEGNAIHKGCLAKRIGEARTDSDGTYLPYTVTQSVGNPTYIAIRLYCPSDSSSPSGYRAAATVSSTGPTPRYYTTPFNIRGGGYKTTRTSGIGMVSSSAVPGMSKLPQEQVPYGYPDPSVIDGTDVPTISNQLKTNYPDLFQDPITITTPQSDGSLRTTTYYPTPWASSSPAPSPSTDYEINPQQQTTPTTKPDTQQDDDTLTDEEIEDIIPAPTPDPVTPEEVEPSPEPEPSPDPAPFPDAPVVPPTDTTPPDTGEGENEPSPVPVGEENAMWAVYNPSNTALSAFGAWLWSPNFIDNILRLFQSPIDGVIGIHKIFITPPRGGSQNIVVGYLDSGVSSMTVPSQYTELNCGSVSLPEYFGNVFDYAPYTEVFIYLPFIGITKLNVADVMRSKITVKYRVDVYTGACLAMITVKRDGFSPIMYTYAGDCAVHYPISAGSYSGIISSVISAGVSALASGVATGGNPVMGGVAAGATFLTHNKGLSVDHSGGLSGNSGAMGPKKPYLIIKRPQPKMAVDAEVYDGLPANYTTAIGSCTGYIKCKEVHLKAPGAYQSELDEIEQLLKSGILVTDE